MCYCLPIVMNYTRMGDTAINNVYIEHFTRTALLGAAKTPALRRTTSLNARDWHSALISAQTSRRPETSRPAWKTPNATRTSCPSEPICRATSEAAPAGIQRRAAPNQNRCLDKATTMMKLMTDSFCFHNCLRRKELFPWLIACLTTARKKYAT